MIVWSSQGVASHALDYHRSPGQSEIEVHAQIVVGPVDDLYFVRSPSLALLWNYLSEIGLRAVWKKVLSRRSEARRNEKFLVVGTGRVCATDATEFGNAQVIFLSTCQPYCVSRLCLPNELLRAAAPIVSDRTANGERLIRCIDGAMVANIESLTAWAGWVPESGRKSPPIDWTFILELLEGQNWDNSTVFDAAIVPTAAKTKTAACANGDSTNATLFGYGNYAKTVILPALPKSISVTRIHEIDPTQIPVEDGNIEWSTSPQLDKEDPNPVCFIAGYHHTHTEIAVAALEAGKAAVSEKPLVVSADQLERLTIGVGAGHGSYYACFHKRYSDFNAMAITDLAVEVGDPISYHCIVYEVPLPRRHWYRWPSSRSRIVSNGCHWIDHFMYLNAFSAAAEFALFHAPDGALNVSILLENDAFFSMVLTDQGSPRIGMQEAVELRAGLRNCRILNSAHYVSEGERGVINRRRINKTESYRNMYREISRRIVSGQPGDPIKSITEPSRVILELDEMLCRQDIGSHKPHTVS